MRKALGRISPDETVQHATNVYGNIDLSKLGCATTSFFTNADELSRDPAALWPLPRFQDQRAGESAITNAALYAITAFIAISVLGLIAAAFQWALRGFKAS